MGALSDTMLAGGCAAQIAAVHGEPVTVLTGLEAGLKFIGVVENETDFDLTSDLGSDPRSKRMIRFRVGSVPRLRSQDVIQTQDGKKWKAVRKPGAAFLTVDFELNGIEAIDT